MRFSEADRQGGQYKEPLLTRGLLTLYFTLKKTNSAQYENSSSASIADVEITIARPRPSAADGA